MPKCNRLWTWSWSGPCRWSCLFSLAFGLRLAKIYLLILFITFKGYNLDETRKAFLVLVLALYSRSWCWSCTYAFNLGLGPANLREVFALVLILFLVRSRINTRRQKPILLIFNISLQRKLDI